MLTAGASGTGSTSRRTVTTELTSCTGGDDKGDRDSVETPDPVYIAGGRGHARRCSTSCASMQVKSVQQQGEGQMTSITRSP